jgi:predicted metal-binding protein
MARIGIITCSNCTQDTNCAAVVCLSDMRKRKGLFDRYANEAALELIGIISCAWCPTLAAPEKIMKRVDALAAFKVDALHFSYCMTALCPFIEKYAKIIGEKYPTSRSSWARTSPSTRASSEERSGSCSARRSPSPRRWATS